MPVFSDPDQARLYILDKMNQGMECQQIFALNGGIEVTCRFSLEHEAKPRVRMLPVEKPPVKQGIFTAPQHIELPYELRDYQQEAVQFAMSHPHCIIELPTGRGKTLTSMAIVNEVMRNKPRRTLVVVPTQILLQQWIADGFKSAGITASGVSAEGKAWGEHTVTTYQSAIRNLNMLAQYDIIIFDEVHHLFSPEYRKVLFALETKPYLIGLTATIREYGEGKQLQDRYFPNVFTKTIEDFQAGESHIPVEIVMMPVNFSEEERALYDKYQRTITRANRTFGPVPEWPKYLRSPDEDTARLARSAISAYAAQKRLLTETPDKLDVILRILTQNNGQYIIFSDTIDGITTIEGMLRENGISEGSIYSGVRPSERRRIIEGLRDKSIRVLVGGSAITEGLDLPDISNAILSSLLVKSSRTYVQRIGRILRPVPGKRVKLFLVYVKNTLEEDNARNVRELIGEDDHGIFS